MEFHYWFLIQDILGVLLAILGLKFAIIYILLMLKRRITLSYLACFMGNIMLVLSGVNLIISPWSLKTWGISLALFLLAWLFGRLVWKKPMEASKN